MSLVADLVQAQHEEELKALQDRIDELENAIRVHRDAQGNDLCWQNDAELYAILRDPPVDNRPTLPPREEFLTNCEKYYQSRLITLRSPPPRFEEDSEE